jgi:hypothetical protein
MRVLRPSYYQRHQRLQRLHPRLEFAEGMRFKEVLMSGVKGRSGRKSDVAVKELRTQMDEAISSSDWHAIWRAALKAAKKGSIPAIELLVEFRYRVASAQVEQTANVGMVAYYLPARPDQPLPASLGLDPHASIDLPLDPAPGPAARIPA